MRYFRNGNRVIRVDVDTEPRSARTFWNRWPRYTA